eukprot:scpid56558/ scgid19318/ Uncharacterized protein C17orf59 homolog
MSDHCAGDDSSQAASFSQTSGKPMHPPIDIKGSLAATRREAHVAASRDHGAAQPTASGGDETDGGLPSKMSWEQDGVAELQHAITSCGPSDFPSPNSPSFEVISDSEIQLAPALAKLRKYKEEDLVNAFTQVSMSDEELVDMPNPNALAAMEATTGHIAESLHHMMGSITANLHAISGKTRVCVGAYGGAVDDLGDNVDETIQMMYQLIMYCEKISQNMQYVYALSDQLRSIKATLAVFEKMVK